MATGIIHIHQQPFESFYNPSELAFYLQNVLGRPSATKETTYLYRYTKISYLIDMLTSRYMHLYPCDVMNDDFETAVLNRHGMLRKIYYTCFTKSDESLAMYKLYGASHNQIIFSISYANLERLIIENASENLNGSFAKDFMV